MQETDYTKSIDILEWPTDLFMTTIRSSSYKLNAEQIQKEMKMNKEIVWDNEIKTIVNVQIVDLRWLLANQKSFLDFSTTLQDVQL